MSYMSRSRDKKEERRSLNRDGPSSVKTTLPKKILEREAWRHGFHSVWEFIANYDIVFEIEKSIKGNIILKFEPREEDP